ncbi:tape measure protein [Lactobacillus delbrueckii subsp. bulgaricus]|uniref:tape measure protein n=1 Tax=Lactobacillus delbrueckii TaxID=1584 RepID=UPI001E5FC81E|nr:tape measure protein [Lactobacillus delbrueckii]MCD5482410.1 tape measure protein [Lactobacillus delbrueckii subsp. bulgaricus]MCD5482462.1 tape measure protein [Lactobacillus delbrueckii subsp. bulgaricus]
MADGVVTIDLKFPANESAFKSDIAQVEEILKKIGSGTGTQAVANFIRRANELKTTASEAGGQVSKSVNEAGKQAGDKMQKNFVSNVTTVEKAASSTAESVSATTTKMGKHAGSEMQNNFGSNSEDVKKSAKDMGQDVDRTAKGMGKGAGDEMADSAQKNIGKVKSAFGSLGDYIKGSFIGSALEQATERVADFFKDMVTQATESFDALKSYTSTMKFAGFDTSEIKKGEEELKEYSKETIYNVGEMSNTAATLAANGVKNYVDVTKALGNLVAVAGGSTQDMQSASLALTQMVGAGKMYAGDWNQFINGIPGASGKLKKALKDAGAYTGNFKDAMSKGKISAQEMIAAIEKLGNTQIAKKAATDTSKFSVAWQGAQESVQDGVLALMDSLGTSGFTGAITAAGNSAYNALASIGKWISKHKDEIATLGKKLGYIKDNLEEIGGEIGQGFVQFFKDSYKWISKFTGSAGDGNDALDKMGLALDKIAENKGALRAVGKGLAAITTAIVGLKVLESVLSFIVAPIKILKSLRGIIVTLIGPLKSLIGLFMSFSGGPIILAIVAIGTAFVLAYKHIKPFRDFVNGIAKKAGSAFNAVARAVSKAFKEMSKAMAPIVKEFKKAWSQLLKFLEALWKDISAVVVGALKILFVVMSPLLLVVIGLVKLAMITIKALIKGAMGFIKTIWHTTWKAIGTILKTAWNVIRDIFKYELKIITDILKLGTDILKGNWKNVWKDIKHIFSDVWNGMKSIVRDIWTGIKEYVADGVNGVIDLINGMITAINKVWTFFGGKGGIDKLSHVHFATGGQLGGDGSVMAIVNDDGSPDPRELIQRKDGTLQMYQERNAKTIINPGDKVYNSQQTKEIFNSVGVHYAKGNVGGDIWSGVKSFFGGVADKLKDAIEWLKHPLKNTAKLIKNATDSFMSLLPDNFKNLAGSMIGKMTSMISDKFKKLIQGYKDDSEDGGGSVGNPGGAGVMRWKSYVAKALEANGIEPTGYRVSKILATIQRESGGNPRAINLWDSNAKAGIPSKGLMQTIGPTFNAYKFAGHGNIYNGYDNLLAAINYIKHRYGTSDAAFARVAASGYAKGGVIDREQMALLGEGNRTEFVVPNPSVAGPSRTYEMIGRAAAYASQAGGGSGSIMSDNALKLVERKLDSLIDYSATQVEELKKPMRSYVLQSDIYKGYNEQRKISDMRGFFVR